MTGTGFRRIGERVVHEGHVVTLATVTVEGPDGQHHDREVVHHQGAVAVVPVLDDGETVVLVRQYRSALDALVLEIPAGKLDVAGEADEAAARRELEEEVGWRADHLEPLITFYNSPGFCDERVTVYLATDMTPGTAAAHGVEEEHMTVEHVALSAVPAMVAAGDLVDAKTVIGLALARERLAAR